MKDQYIREYLLKQHMGWNTERNKLVQKALASDIYEEKDECYRQAAVLGIRLASIEKVTKDISAPDCSDATRARSFQRHSRDMARLKYRTRPDHVTQDAIDTEVISQFYSDGVVVNDPNTKRPQIAMTV